MPQPAIRRLGKADLEAHRSVLALYADAFDDAQTYARGTPSDLYLTRLLAREDFIELVAEVDNTVVAALSAYVFTKFERECAEIYIYDLAVDKRYRRLGIASALIAALKPVARSLGADVIIVQGESGDHPAEALYQKFGQRLLVSSFDIGVSE